MHRPIGRCRRSEHRRSLTSLNMSVFCCTFISGCERRIICVKLVKIRVWTIRVRVGCRSGVSATSSTDAIDFLCFERRWRPIRRYTDAFIRKGRNLGTDVGGGANVLHSSWHHRFQAVMPRHRCSRCNRAFIAALFSVIAASIITTRRQLN